MNFLPECEEWATEARKEILRRMYPADAEGWEIMAALTKVKGPQVPNWKAVATYCNNQLGLRRSSPSAVMRKARKPAPISPEDAIRAASARFAAALGEMHRSRSST